MVGKDQPLYMKIYQFVLQSIRSGEYSENKRLPSEKELAARFSVSTITSKRALQMLADHNYIVRIPGRGSFVNSHPEQEKTQPEADESSSGARFRTIGLVFSDITESYGTRLFLGIEGEASKHNSYVISRRSFGRQDKEEEAIDALIQMNVDGIIIMPVQGEHYNPKILRLILDGYPIVLIDRNLRGLSASLVATDNAKASKMATDYLLNLGHRRISFLAPPMIDTSTIEDRKDGFIQSHAENGVVVDESIWLTDISSTLPGRADSKTIREDIRKVIALLKSHPDITCMFATEYNIAQIALEATRELHLRVPQDISILAYDGPLSYMNHYFLTHVRQREQQMGINAVQLILQQIENHGFNRKILLDADLIIGESTAEVPS